MQQRSFDVIPDVRTMAYVAGGLSRRTFQNYMTNDPTLGFIKRVGVGSYEACAASLSAWDVQRNGGNHRVPVYRFVGGFRCDSNRSSV
jgi:hypothetical protein